VFERSDTKHKGFGLWQKAFIQKYSFFTFLQAASCFDRQAQSQKKLL
jgi:hypothetical protein